MAQNAQPNKINYIEFTTPDIEAVKKFYSAVFGWSFKDWGADYIDASAETAGVALGFARGEAPKPLSSPLVILYSPDLAATQKAIEEAGGSIVTPTFEFPGGRRFHFSDGAGNVLGVWSE